MTQVGTFSFGSLWNPISAAVRWIMDRFEGIDIEVRSVTFRNVTNSKSVFELITRHPIAYLGRFQLSNGTDKRRGIKKAQLAVGGRIYLWQEEDVDPLSAGDVRIVDFVFPALPDSPSEGRFELVLTDSAGRCRRASGKLR